MKGTITQFDLKHLPKISGAEIAFSKQFSDLKINVDAVNQAIGEAFNTIEPDLMRSATFSLKTCLIEKKEKALCSIDDKKFAIFGSLADEGIPFGLFIERRTAKELVYQLLGSEPESHIQDQVTGIEEGVFAFLLTTVLNALRHELVDKFGVSTRLGSLGEGNTASGIFAAESHLIAFSFSLTIKETTSEVRLLVAAHPALSTLLRSEDTSDEIVELGILRAGNAQVSASLVVGEISLSVNELGSLQEGDVVLLEKPNVIMTGNVLNGELDLLLGKSPSQSLKAHLSTSDSGRYSLQISNTQ
jgi:hypothetical protein